MKLYRHPPVCSLLLDSQPEVAQVVVAPLGAAQLAAQSPPSSLSCLLLPRTLTCLNSLPASSLQLDPQLARALVQLEVAQVAAAQLGAAQLIMLPQSQPSPCALHPPHQGDKEEGEEARASNFAD